MSKIHYAGECRTRNMHILPGWAACCSGFKAEKIRAEGRHSFDRAKVNCAACLKVITKHDAHAAAGGK